MTRLNVPGLDGEGRSTKRGENIRAMVGMVEDT